MANVSKRVKKIVGLVDRTKVYDVNAALDLVKKTATAKFDESVDVAVNLGIDAKKSDQVVRGSVVLPRGTGKTVRVAVFTQGANAEKAKNAGADVVGFDDLADKVKGGFMDFDVVIATPDAMKVVGPLGQILGPRGLMPNPKVGTVTFDVGKAVRELKGGRVEFRVEKAGIVHARIGKVSFGGQKLRDNAWALLELLHKLKTASAKGTYMKSITVSTTHGPGIKLDPNEVTAHLTVK
jgi:large subunit ribosomal protein L1